MMVGKLREENEVGECQHTGTLMVINTIYGEYEGAHTSVRDREMFVGAAAVSEVATMSWHSLGAITNKQEKKESGEDWKLSGRSGCDCRHGQAGEGKGREGGRGPTQDGREWPEGHVRQGGDSYVSDG